MRFAEWVASTSCPAKDGSSTRDHLEAAAARGSASAIALLTPPPMPEALVYVWEWWRDLHAARGSAFSGVAPLTYLDIDAWSRLTKSEPTPFEVRTLLRVDHAFRSALTPA